MKLKFKQQDFQTDAVNAVCGLFEGQKRQSSTFSMELGSGQTSLDQELGISNGLYITDEQMIANMQNVQRKNSLPLTAALCGRQFSIEMETGTGKTYVYTKTIYELNRLYGFTKFIIVVPGVPIREGVNKSLEMTSDHFAAIYDNVPSRFFIYSSAKLSDVRAFATSANIEIMIINIDAFRKAENVINQEHDKLSGDTAIGYIRGTNPIVIIDEPQSVDNTQKAKDAIASLNPLCVLRYSATHRERVNLLYRLTPVDAFQMGLVKQICVSSNQVAVGFNKPYIKLLSVSHENGFKARIELDVENKAGKVSRKVKSITPGADLFRLSGNRGLYNGYVLSGIDCTNGHEQIEFANTEVVHLHEAIGDVDETLIKRIQIRRTIEAHFDKELRYTDKGIKVLSLFFIDEVKKYRGTDGEKGIYAQLFEEEYTRLLGLKKYERLKSLFPVDVTAVHNGYFSQDKKGHFKDTNGDTQADYSTYNTIMRDKEWLLSFDCPLRFIFSHSALKEGWDNPNVFQVCTLIEQKSTLTARQKVGRGLRLCVDQNGDRVDDRDINILHVMANESFAEFADSLQHEIEAETGIKFGSIQLDLFSGITFEDTHIEDVPLTQAQTVALLDHLAGEGFIKTDAELPERTELPKELEVAKVKAVEHIAREGGISQSVIAGLSVRKEIIETKTISHDGAQNLVNHFRDKGYISQSGAIRDSLKTALQDGTLDLPPQLEKARAQIVSVIRKSAVKLPIRNHSNEVQVRLKKEVATSPEFEELWSRIRQKTVYRVRIDEEKLVLQSAYKIHDMDQIPKARVITQTADIHIAHPGVEYVERGIKTADITESYTSLPNVLQNIGSQVQVKRSTVFDILTQSGRLGDFLNNPQLFIEKTVEIIREVRQELAVSGVSYKKVDGEEYYWQEIFDAQELIAYLDKNALPVENSIYDHIIYDSPTVERPFAEALDEDPDVKLFLKLPDKFKIDTPIGTYNPDWAVYIDKDGEKKLYFVIETKGTTQTSFLSGSEEGKIFCGKKHFEALGGDVRFCAPVRDWIEFKAGNI